MPETPLESLVSAAKNDPAFRRAWADLRAACASVLDAKDANGALVALLGRYLVGNAEETPICPAFEGVRRLLEHCSGRACPAEPSAKPFAVKRRNPSAGQALPLEKAFKRERESGKILAAGVEALLRDHFGLGMEAVRVLDPWAGDGRLLAGLGEGERFANVADPVLYARAAVRLGVGLCFADSFRLPDPSPTPVFDFSEDENATRIARQQATGFQAVVTDLRGATRPDSRALRRSRGGFGGGIAAVRWMADRLGEEGVVAFLSDGAFFDAPESAGIRTALEREFGLVAHAILGSGEAVTFLVRGQALRGFRLLYGQSTEGAGYSEIEWRELTPEGDVWRTEILRPEWKTFPPLSGGRNPVFAEAHVGVGKGTDSIGSKPKGARRVLRQPFLSTWRVPDREARREPWPSEGPTLLILAEPFGVFAALAPPVRGLGTAVPLRATAGTLRLFRAVYGAGIGERDLFDYALALLHHPTYRERYHEDLRRGGPRLPPIKPEALARLADLPDAPAVGPETAFGTGWNAPEAFEPGTVPDYDDPFASPYARADVEPGFLLLAGLGAALALVHTQIARLSPYPLEVSGEVGAVEGMWLSRDRSRVVLGEDRSLGGIPSEAFEYRVGRRSPVEWVVSGLRSGRTFDGGIEMDPARQVGQAVTAALEASRLVGLLAQVPLDVLTE